MTNKLAVVAVLGLLASPMTGKAGLVTVWDTLDGAQMGGGGMTIGNFSSSTPNLRLCASFLATSPGYFANFSFGGSQTKGTSDWLFTLRADGGGVPDAVLETLPLVDVNRTATAIYEVTAGGATLLSAGTPYWLMAELPIANLGAWARIGTGTEPGTRAYCDLKVGCPTYSVLNDAGTGAARIQVTAIPAPATLALVGIGLIAAVFSRRRGSVPSSRFLTGRSSAASTC